jgi:hypothetical protein
MSRALLALVMMPLMLVVKVPLRRGVLAVKTVEADVLLRGQNLFK